MSETWTIGELADRAAGLLGAEPRVNGRIREVPNERLIRWYTTIGLLDPPLARRGRVALYGRRHLLQLVAVKRRQADGLSIAAIQAELAGATDSALARIAGLPGPSGTAGAMAGRLDEAHDSAPRERFWTRPAPAPAVPDGPAARERPDALDPLAAVPAADPAEPVDVVHGVRLAPGVTVLLDLAGHVPGAGETAMLRAAAEPLVAALAALGLAPAAAGRSALPPDHSEGMTP